MGFSRPWLLVATNGWVSSATSSPQNTERFQQYEKEFEDLKRQFGSLRLGAGKPHTDVHKTVAIGGLQALGFLKHATPWLEDKLREIDALTHCGIYKKGD